MLEIDLHFACNEDHNLDTIAQLLQEQIAQLPMVQEVETSPEKMKSLGIDVAAAIGTTVVIVKSSTELIKSIREFIAAVKSLVAELGLEKAFIDVEFEKIPLEKLTDEQICRLEED